MNLLTAGRNGDRLADLEVIDMHGHLGRYAFAIPDASAAALVATMDRIGVRAAVCSHMQSWSPEAARGNQEVLEAMRAFPGRILGYASAWPGDPDRVTEEIARCLAAGFVGIKLHNSNGFPYTTPAYEGAFRLADERSLPVLLHAWGGEEDLAQIAELAARFPRASILVAHAGCRNPDGYVRLAQQRPNVYLDLAYSLSPRGLVAWLAERAGVEKLVWGSDGYFFSPAHQIGKVLGANLPDEARARILSTNAREILARARPAG